MRQSKNWLKTLFLDLISIVHKWMEDSNNKNRNLKAKTYQLALKTML